MSEINENHWESVQAKTFIKWINDKLSKGGFRVITDIYEDLKSGVNLGCLLRVIMDENVQYNTKPFTRIQKIENVEILLAQIKNRGITLVNIGSEDIVDGNRKLILGLVWTLILKLSIADIVVGDLSVRDEILRWCKEVTKPYSNVNIYDLGKSWQDGLGFNAIIHRFRPDLVKNFYELKGCEKYKNLEQAFSIAEEHLDIPRLLDVEDLADVIRPDEKSMITYLSQYYQAFNKYEKEKYSFELVNNVLKKIEWSIQNRNLYEIKARNLLKNKKKYNEKVSELKDMFNNMLVKLEEVSELNSNISLESNQLHSLLGSINTIHSSFNLKPYNPPQEISINKLSHTYFTVSDCIDISYLNNFVEVIPKVEKLQNETSEVNTILINNCELEPKLEIVCNKYKNLLTQNIDDARINSDYNQLKDTIKKHHEFLKNIQDENVKSEAFIKTAVKMFDDLKKKEISFNDLKSIFYQLGIFLDEALLDKLEMNDGKIDKPTFVEIIKSLSMRSYDAAQLRTAFKVVTKGEDAFDINDKSICEVDLKNIAYYNSGSTKIEVEKLFDDYMRY